MRLLRPVLSLCLGVVLVSTAQAQAPQLPGPKPANATQPIPLPPPNPKTPPQLTSEDVTAFLDGFLPLQLQRDDVAGATISDLSERPAAHPQRLRLRRLQEEDTRRSCRHNLPSRLDLQALHLRLDDAARRAGQAQPRRQRPAVSRLQDQPRPKRHRRRAHHSPQPRHAHRRLRGRAARLRLRQIRQAARRHPHLPHPQPAEPLCRCRAKTSPTPTTASRSSATSCSASPANPSPPMCSTTSSRRSA